MYVMKRYSNCYDSKMALTRPHPIIKINCFQLQVIEFEFSSYGAWFIEINFMICIADFARLGTTIVSSTRQKFLHQI